MTRVGLLYREGSPEARELASQLARWLKARGVETCSLDAQDPLPECARRPEAEWGRGLDSAVVIGGDGTLLRAAQLIDSPEVRVLGVKLGGLGFLTEVQPEEVYTALELMLAGRERATERMMLEGVIRNGEEVSRFKALNEVAITCAGMPRVVDINAEIDGVFVTSFRADGVLISTPTGSTAYTMAAGGPIVHPGVRCITLTQIAPHTLTSRPLVIPESSAVQVTLARPDQSVHVTVDSQRSWPFGAGQTLEIRAAEHGITLVSSPSMSYYDILRNKLRWGER